VQTFAGHQFRLRDVWRFYDRPYGFAVPVVVELGASSSSGGKAEDDDDKDDDEGGGGEPEGHDVTEVHYTPFLSAIQLFVEAGSPYLKPKGSNPTGSPTGVVAASTVPTEASSEEQKEANGEEGEGEGGKGSSGEQRGGRRLLYEYFEKKAPNAREPVLDTINQEVPLLELACCLAQPAHPN